MKDDSEIFRHMVWAVLSFLVSLFLLAILIGLCGCTKTVYVPTETVRTETNDVTRWRTDTVTQSDTRLIMVKGDTVYDRHTIWRDRIREVRDTVIVERIDSVSKPYPVEVVKEVPRQRGWWETALMWIGVAALIGAGYAVWRKAKR